MTVTRLFLAAACALAVACGSSPDPAVASAATIGLSAALSAALSSSASGTVRSVGGEGELQLRASGDVRQALSDLARSGAASSVSCTGGCGSSTSGTATAHCSLTSTPIACPGGGSASGTGTIDFTFSCSTHAFSATFSFQFGFSSCSAQGITVNTSSGPIAITGSLDTQAKLTETVKGSGLQIKGSYCAKTIDQTCSVDATITSSGQTITATGQVCGCDISKLAAAQDVCKASC